VQELGTELVVTMTIEKNIAINAGKKYQPLLMITQDVSVVPGGTRKIVHLSIKLAGFEKRRYQNDNK
jgi:hypothetical protein